LLKEAVAVVYGESLNTRSIPIFDTDGNKLNPLTNSGVFSLDQNGRVRVEKGSIRNLYAFGSCGLPLCVQQRGGAEG
jgi:hypothetical protein